MAIAAPPTPVRSIAVALLAAFALTGCARYEYDLVAPQELAAHVGTKEWVTASIEPLSYRLLTVDNRLVMQIHNPSEQTVRLLGDQSTVVDPKGESHALPNQTIAPQAFTKLILPPMPTRVERTGPSIGFGFGVGMGSAYRHGYHPYGFDPYGYGPPYYEEPRYYAVYDPNDATFWEWDGEGSIRMSLKYARGDETFSHNLVIGRKKV